MNCDPIAFIIVALVLSIAAIAGVGLGAYLFGERRRR